MRSSVTDTAGIAVLQDLNAMFELEVAGSSAEATAKGTGLYPVKSNDGFEGKRNEPVQGLVVDSVQVLLSVKLPKEKKLLPALSTFYSLHRLMLRASGRKENCSEL